MSVRLKLEWKGVDALMRHLEKTMPDAFDQSMTDAMEETAQLGKERARELVPVDTGALKNSIRVERFATPAGYITYTGIRAGGYIRNPRTNKLVDYASYVEYGTSRQRPQPYLRPAVEYAMKRLPDLFWRKLSRRVNVL